MKAVHWLTVIITLVNVVKLYIFNTIYNIFVHI